MSKGKRLLKATGKVTKSVGIVAVSAIVTAFAGKASKGAIINMGEGAKQIYNIVANSLQKW